MGTEDRDQDGIGVCPPLHALRQGAGGRAAGAMPRLLVFMNEQEDRPPNGDGCGVGASNPARVKQADGREGE